MKNNLAKLLILCSAVIAISGCNKNDKSCFVVETLKTGDDYKIKEFSEAYGKYLDENNIHYDSDVTVDAVNIMPHDIFDTYGAGLFMTQVNNLKYELKEAYLYYNKALYKVSCQMIGGEPVEVNSLAFTDVNNDGSYEITVAYNYTQISKSSYLTTLDTMTLTNVSGFLYNTNITFKRNGNVIGLYGKDYLKDDDKTIYHCDIKLYERNYELSLPKYELECDTYKVQITWSRSQTNVPVDYLGLNHIFSIKSELTYLGEDFEIKGGAIPWGAQISFKNDSQQLNNVSNSYAAVDGTITIKKGQVFTGNTSILDKYDEKTPLGTYDMEVFFKQKTITVEKALIVK